MNYKGLHIEAKNLPLLFPVFQNEEAIFLESKERQIYIWDKKTFKQIFNYTFNPNISWNAKMSNDKFIINLKQINKTIIYDTKTKVSEEYDVQSTSIFASIDQYYIGYKSGDYILFDNTFNFIKSFKRPDDVHFHFSNYGIIFSSIKTSENKFIKLYDPISEQFLWEHKLDEHCSQLDIWKEYCIVEERINNQYRISCINLKNKKTPWTISGNGTSWHLFDYKRESILLSFGKKYTEFDLKSGAILNECLLKRKSPEFSTEKMMVIGENSIYFYNSLNENIIGAFNRITGEIEWVENFVPKQAKSVNIWFWSEASNGEHLIFIQDSNHPELLKMKIL